MPPRLGATRSARARAALGEVLRPIAITGADAALELSGPALATVYVRRGAVDVAIDVLSARGNGKMAEERIAGIVVNHPPEWDR